MNKIDIKPSDEFSQAIEEALEDMKPFTHLQNVFDEFGYFVPLNIVLGKSLKNILPSSSLSDTTTDDIPEDFETFEPLKSHLDKLNISHLLTQKGDIIKKEEISSWIQNADDDLEIIEVEKMILLYEILEKEQQNKINNIMNTQDDFKIIMTGVVGLKDLDNNHTEHFKRIDAEPSLDGKNYEVFG